MSAQFDFANWTHFNVRNFLAAEKTDLIRQELEEQKKSSQIYFRRFKKEKRYRRKLQEQLEQETK